MPMLVVREVGVSYMIEGIDASGLDGERLLAGVESRYGVAAAPMRIFPPPREADLTAILVDRKGDTWGDFRRRLEGWVADQGGRDLGWEEFPERSFGVLRFEL